MELIASLAHSDSRWVFRFPYTFFLLILAELFQLFCLSSAILIYNEGGDKMWTLMRGASSVIVICQILGALIGDPESFLKQVAASGFAYYTVTLGLSDNHVSVSPLAVRLLTLQSDIYLWSFLYIIGLAVLAFASKVLWFLISICSARLFLRLHGFKEEEKKQ